MKKLTLEQVQKAFPELEIIKELKSKSETKAILEANYQKLIEKGYRCCFCGKKDVGLLFDSPFTFVFCRNTNCSPSYRWIQKIPNDNLEVFEIIPRSEKE